MTARIWLSDYSADKHSPDDQLVMPFIPLPGQNANGPATV
jgi:hypothetical protein